jgi:hypothetical protein
MLTRIQQAFSTPYLAQTRLDHLVIQTTEFALFLISVLVLFVVYWAVVTWPENRRREREAAAREQLQNSVRGRDVFQKWE